MFHYCLINLIENVVKYGLDGLLIVVVVKCDLLGFLLLVMDEGFGLFEGEEVCIFEMFVCIEGFDCKGGIGLGLVIVKGFVEVMGLMVSVINCVDY